MSDIIQNKNMDTEKIIADLKNAGVTIAEIAFRCDVASRTVERWADNKFKPTRANKICLEQWHKRKIKEQNKCKLCKRELNIKGDLTSEDCGGDCLRCMAEIGEDPDCIKKMYKITKEEKFKLKK